MWLLVKVFARRVTGPRVLGLIWIRGLSVCSYGCMGDLWGDTGLTH